MPSQQTSLFPDDPERRPAAPAALGRSSDRRASSTHLRAARRLSRRMQRLHDRPDEHTAAGVQILRHLRALLKEDVISPRGRDDDGTG